MRKLNLLWATTLICLLPLAAWPQTRTETIDWANGQITGKSLWCMDTNKSTPVTIVYTVPLGSIKGICDATCNGGGDCSCCDETDVCPGPSDAGEHYREIDYKTVSQFAQTASQTLTASYGVNITVPVDGATVNATTNGSGTSTSSSSSSTTLTSDSKIPLGTKGHAPRGTRWDVSGEATLKITVFLKMKEYWGSLGVNILYSKSYALEMPPIVAVDVKNDVKTTKCGCHVKRKPTPTGGKPVDTGGSDKPKEPTPTPPPAPVVPDNPVPGPKLPYSPDFKAPDSGSKLPGGLRLPDGAIYATATVSPDTRIRILEEGEAVVATADVVEIRRVKPGDVLEASKTSSVHFKSGTGMLILAGAVAGLIATSGSSNITHPEHSAGLPVYNGTSTLFVGSNRPFAGAGIGPANGPAVPGLPHAEFLDPSGAKVGELATFDGLNPSEAVDLHVRTMDSMGDTVDEKKVGGGSLDGTPVVAFDRPVYKAGEKGVLRISNQANYSKLIDMTRFGGAANLAQQPIQLIGSGNVKLPGQVPFQSGQIPVQVKQAGQATAMVIMPRSVPPRQADKDAASADPAAGALDRWRKEVENHAKSKR